MNVLDLLIKWDVEATNAKMEDKVEMKTAGMLWPQIWSICFFGGTTITNDWEVSSYCGIALYKGVINVGQPFWYLVGVGNKWGGWKKKKPEILSEFCVSKDIQYHVWPYSFLCLQISRSNIRPGAEKERGHSHHSLVDETKAAMLRVYYMLTADVSGLVNKYHWHWCLIGS